MEIDVTHMVNDAAEMPLLSGSAFELGQDVARITWRNSCEYAASNPLLRTDEEKQAARDHFREYGAWSREEIDAWSEEELQGIMVQDVASAIREMECFHCYEDYEEAAREGSVSGRFFRGDDNRFYFYLGI